MILMPEIEAVEVIERFRKQLLRMDAEAARRLIDAYGPTWTRVEGQINDLLEEIAEKQLSISQAGRLTRFQRCRVSAVLDTIEA